MKLLISKFLYPEHLGRIRTILEPYAGLALQLAFFKRSDFMRFDHYEIRDCANELNISIPSIHAPTTDIFHDDFIPVLKLIKEVYKVKVVTIHPQLGEFEDALARFRAIANKISKLDIILAYENFYPTKHARKKWIYLPEAMYEHFRLPFLGITYDCAHVVVNDKTLEIFEKILDKIEVVHLSNRSKGMEHLPFEQGDFPIFALLDILKSKNFKGLVALEYMPAYENKLFEDLERIKNYLSSAKEF